MNLSDPKRFPGNLVARSIYDHKVLSLFVSAREFVAALNRNGHGEHDAVEFVAVLDRKEAECIASTLQSEHGITHITNCADVFTPPAATL
jgi:hypothetical protein